MQEHAKGRHFLGLIQHKVAGNPALPVLESRTIIVLPIEIQSQQKTIGLAAKTAFPGILGTSTPNAAIESHDAIARQWKAGSKISVNMMDPGLQGMSFSQLSTQHQAQAVLFQCLPCIEEQVPVTRLSSIFFHAIRIDSSRIIGNRLVGMMHGRNDLCVL